ncbi:MAG: phage tail protein [Verrucomicrobia bacterium]|nr:phage tail protein [Verrucomicrobiota bacterium]
MGYKNAGVGNLNLALENSANFVVSGGKVGIRTSSPSDALQVNGNISSRAETATDGYIRLSPGGADYAGTVEFFKPGGPTRIAYLGYKSGGTANLGLNLEAGAHFVVGGGNVGIGTSAPSEKLEVAGTVKANRFVGDGSGLIGAAPPGSIMAYGGITAPPGWLLCNGATYLRTEYPQLFSAIGTAFGAPDDSRFRVPDTGGLFLRGRANGSTHDPDRDSRTASAAGGNVGDRVGSYQGSQFESHTHAAARNSGGKELASGGSGSRPSEGTTGAAGGSETRPKNLYVNYIIKY